MTTHAFRHEPRSTLSDQQRAKLFLERGGRCHRCTRKIMHGEKWFDEHVHSLGTGGGNDWRNRDLTCINCFPLKNAEDAGKQAKVRELAVSHIIPPSQRQKKGKGWKWKKVGMKYDWEKRRYVPIE